VIPVDPITASLLLKGISVNHDQILEMLAQQGLTVTPNMVRATSAAFERMLMDLLSKAPSAGLVGKKPIITFNN
jgi:hypothetical protein